MSDFYNLPGTDAYVLKASGGGDWWDYGCWEKYTNFEMGARVPMVMRVPGIPPSRTAALVESVDIFPSLVEAATAGAAALPACPLGARLAFRAPPGCAQRGCLSCPP